MKTSRRKKGYFLFFFFLLFLFYPFLIPLSAERQVKAKEEALVRPDLKAIEEALFNLINEEREKNGLPGLRLSSGLSSLARQHSQEMAAQNRLSHFSSDDKSYSDRLVSQGFFFIQAGENIARSETFNPFVIHQSMMTSPEHRANILHPDFDEIGLGVAQGEGGNYFITQDFIQSLPVLTDEEARNKIISMIQTLRQARALPELSVEEEINVVAQLFARAKAKNVPPPTIPSHLGEVLIINLVTPLLNDLTEIEKPLLEPRYKTIGAGVDFGRNPDHPGGTYFITLLLASGIPPASLSPEDMRDMFLNSLNKIRLEASLRPLKLKQSLCRQAERIGFDYLNQKNRSMTSVELLPGQIGLCYLTQSLDSFPRGLKNWLQNPYLLHAGIHICLVKTQDFPNGAYLVAIILE
jgi:uncharacterized protein YkwD